MRQRERERENGSRWCVSSRRSLTEGCRREGRGGKGRKGFGGRRRGALHRPRTQLCIGTAPSFPSPAPLRQPSSPTERTPSPRPGPRATTDRIDHRHGGRGGGGCCAVNVTLKTWHAAVYTPPPSPDTPPCIHQRGRTTVNESGETSISFSARRRNLPGCSTWPALSLP